MAGVYLQMDELSILRVPRALKDVGDLVLDMKPIFLAERRGMEIGTASHTQAPELMAFFNSAFLLAARYMQALQFELVKAKDNLLKIQSDIIMDKLPNILKAKGLWSEKNPTGNAEIRQMVLVADPDYIAAKDIVTNLECHQSLFQDRKKYFENCYNSAKKLMGDSNFLHNKPNPNLVTPLQPLERSKEEPEGNSKAWDMDDFFGDAK